MHMIIEHTEFSDDVLTAIVKTDYETVKLRIFSQEMDDEQYERALLNLDNENEQLVHELIDRPNVRHMAEIVDSHHTHSF